MVKYLGKKVATLSSVLLFSTLANAAEVFNKDGTDLSISGRVLAGGETQADTAVKYNEVETGNSLRFNIKGSTTMQNNWQGFFATEYQFNFDADQDFSLNPRLSYVGVKNEAWTLSVGKQYSAYYDVAVYTDQLNVWGGEASVVRRNGLDLAERISKSVTLRYRTGNLALAVMGAQGYDGEVVETDLDEDTDKGLPAIFSVNEVSKKYETNGSLEYTLAENFKLGAGYSFVVSDIVNKTTFSNTDEVIVGGVSVPVQDSSTDKSEYEYKTQKYVYGGTFNSGALTVAAIGLVMKDSWSNGYYNGAEAYASYKLTDLGSNVYTGYNYLNVDDNGDDDKAYNYVAVGYAHYFAKNLYAFAEYRYDARTKQQKENALTETQQRKELSNDVSAFGAYVRYNF